MHPKLELVLSWVGLVTAVAYCLGWLKVFYYFDAFGIGLQGLELSPTDYLFESWFVLENVAFFILLAWLVIHSRHWAMWIVGVVYALVPILSHYAFLYPHNALAVFLISYRHTILKIVPFVVLIVLVIAEWAVPAEPERSGRGLVATSMRHLAWPYSHGALAVFVMVIAAWSISTAKHFGSYDANQAMLSPDEYLPRVTVELKPGEASRTNLTGSELFLLFANQRQLFIWDRSGFSFSPGPSAVKILVVPRQDVRVLALTKPHYIQRGSLYL